MKQDGEKIKPFTLPNRFDAQSTAERKVQTELISHINNVVKLEKLTPTIE